MGGGTALTRALRGLPFLLLGLGLLPAVASAQAPRWAVEDGAIRFTAFQQGAPVEGHFGRFTADIAFDPDALSGTRIEVVIETASIATGHKDRDTTLRSPDLFDVERWPTARFVTTEVRHLGGDAFEAKGLLTIRDVQKGVVLPFTLTIEERPGDASRELAHARGGLAISRLDYGVGQGEWASTGTVAERVEIEIEIVAVRQR